MLVSTRTSQTQFSWKDSTKASSSETASTTFLLEDVGLELSFFLISSIQRSNSIGIETWEIFTPTSTTQAFGSTWMRFPISVMENALVHYNPSTTSLFFADVQNYYIDMYKKFKEAEFEKQFPYIPGFRSLRKRSLGYFPSIFHFKPLSDINARHYSNEQELNLHSLNSLMQTYHSYNFLKYNLNQKLPFVLTRGTFAGSGRYAVHWTGDIPSDWTFMGLSIPSMFSFNLFGMPMIGSDICGFEGNVTEVLCSRWAQIGSLYPFARNHNHENAKDQEFHRLGPTLLETARKSLHLRYSLLKYYYTLFLLSVVSDFIWDFIVFLLMY